MKSTLATRTNVPSVLNVGCSCGSRRYHRASVSVAMKKSPLVARLRSPLVAR